MKNGRTVAGRKSRTPKSPPAAQNHSDAQNIAPAKAASDGKGRGGSFRLRADESLKKGVRRIARKQLKKAVAELTESSGAASGEAVHRARRRLKRLRALLRVARPGLQAKRYGRENAALRDAARPLSEVRDAGALVAALDKLRDHAKGVEAAPFRAVRKWLEGRRKEVRREVLEERKEPDTVAAALKKARRRARDWDVTGGGWDVVGGGLRQVYRAGRQALRAAQEKTNDETLHEWRKQSKYLRHALELLEPLGDAAVKGARENAHDLGDQLGDDHDLAVLAGLLEGEGGPLAGAAAAALRPLIDRRRAELQREAFSLGADLYRRRPKAFAGRLWPYWHGWRATGAVRQG